MGFPATDLAMRRAFVFLAAFGLAAVTLAGLAGCSSRQIEDLPVLGLPADTPARPATPYSYPAVHDMPPPRGTEPLSAEEQLQMEQELTKLRNRQTGARADEGGDKPATEKKPAKATKNKPAAAGTGAQPNP